ncbi:hypothetical protein [Hymenobacter terrenus]|uniref:hypothetical protein n=1 Tax=Hymenobacter terrenus TaxID=1629124 RepID=UPI0006192D4F|nr:hypothetical protein [Hymenobacter terrenus]
MDKPQQAYDIEFSDTGDQAHGWCYGQPVGLSSAQWPRSRVNGLPMAHIFTCLVPPDYRTEGESRVAISLFQADDHVADEVSGVAEVLEGELPPETDPAAGPFGESLRTYAQEKHPQEQYFEDLIGGGWAMVWLTEPEFRSAPTAIPDAAVAIFPGYDSTDGTSVYEHNQPAEYVQLVARPYDPNVGKPLEDFPDKEAADAYIPLFSAQSEALGFDKLFWGKTHFGGTASPCQGVPAFSPFYVEFDEIFGGANLGGDGVAQIDLLNKELNWACG